MEVFIHKVKVSPESYCVGISLSKAGPFHLTVQCGLNNSSYNKWSEWPSKNQHKVRNKETSVQFSFRKSLASGLKGGQDMG